MKSQSKNVNRDIMCALVVAFGYCVVRDAIFNIKCDSAKKINGYQKIGAKVINKRA